MKACATCGRAWFDTARSLMLDPTSRLEPVAHVSAFEQTMRTSARYGGSEEHHHERKPSPHRHPSASTSGEKAEQATRADCRRTGGRTGCARRKGAANLFTIPLECERETASSRGLEPTRPIEEVVAKRICSPRYLRWSIPFIEKMMACRSRPSTRMDSWRSRM